MMPLSKHVDRVVGEFAGPRRLLARAVCQPPLASRPPGQPLAGARVTAASLRLANLPTLPGRATPAAAGKLPATPSPCLALPSTLLLTHRRNIAPVPQACLT